MSTCRGVYGKTDETAIPSQRLMQLLESNCARVFDTERDADPGRFVEIEL